MIEWAGDLKVAGTELYLDSRCARGSCFISHAHSDHLGRHARMIATPATAELSAHRLGAEGLGEFTELEYGKVMEWGKGMRLMLSPAGHVLGSAMIRLEREEGSLLYTGDFTLQVSLTAEVVQICTADQLVMETTYGLPMFRFPERGVVIEQLLELVEGAFREGRQPIVMGYSLGKAQEVTRILGDAGHVVTLHGAPHGLAGIYEKHGARLGRYRRYGYGDFHGERAMDLRERGVLVAPPRVARTGFVTQFENPMTVMMSGWGMLKGANFRYGVEHCLPLSDHADFGQLVEMVERVGAKKVFTHHGYRREFAEYLRSRGIDARMAEPDKQLRLFE